MNIVWNIIEENREVKVMLVYNVYLGTKKVFVDNSFLLELKGFNKNKNIVFKHNNNEYEIDLVPEGYGYTGFLINDQGDKMASEVKTEMRKKTSLWIIPFVIINMSIPIVAVEAFTPWVIGVLSSYITAKVSQDEYLSMKKKFAIFACISIIAWVVYYWFYSTVKGKSGNNGFLPF